MAPSARGGGEWADSPPAEGGATQVARRLYQEDGEEEDWENSQVLVAGEGASLSPEGALVPSGRLQEPLRAYTALLHGLRADFDSMMEDIHQFRSEIDVAQSRNAYTGQAASRQQRTMARLTAPDAAALAAEPAAGPRGAAVESLLGGGAGLEAAGEEQSPAQDAPTPPRGPPTAVPGTAYSAVSSDGGAPASGSATRVDQAESEQPTMLDVSVDSLLSRLDIDDEGDGEEGALRDTSPPLPSAGPQAGSGPGRKGFPEGDTATEWSATRGRV